MDDEGVTDVIGTILMVGITVAMMVGLSVLILGAAGPADRVNMDARIEVRPGSDGAWGTGDETVRLSHVGGEPLATASALVRITVNGTATDFSGAALDGGFADGTFAFGDTWAATLNIPQDARVRVFLIDTQGNSIVTSGALTARQAGTSGTSATTYVGSNVTATGSVSSFSAAQDAADGGAEASLEEGPGTGSATKTVNADGVNSGQTDGQWTSPSNAVGQDDTDATTTDNQPRDLQVTLADPAPEGSVTTVVLKARVAIDGYSDDNFRLRACFGGTCGTQSGDLEGAGAYTEVSYDATLARPGGGGWDWSDINNLEIRVQNTRDGGRDGTWRVDHVWAEVTHTTGAGFDMDIRFHWSGVPAGNQELQLRYRVADDTFNMEVWNGVQWNARGTLGQTSASVFSYTLLSSEYNAGSPRIRFVDLDTGASSGTLFIDYARVVTT